MTKTYTVSGFSYQNITIMSVMAILAFLPFSGTAYANENGSKNPGTGVEVNIGANGNTLVRGAKVTSVSGTQVNANTTYGSSILNWIVKTDSNTNFTAKQGSTGLANIAVGDTISFNGSLDQAVSGLTVNAKVVKDWTQVETKKNLSGIVSSINATLGSFTLSHDNSTTSVQTNSGTTFRLTNGASATFANIFLNAKVKVGGLLNASTSIFTATSVDIGTSTKNGWDQNDRNNWRNWVRSKVWLNLWNH